MILTAFVILSILFGPQRGVISRVLQALRNRQSFAQDRLLTVLYRLAVSHGQLDYAHAEKTLILMETEAGSVRQGLRALKMRGLASEQGHKEWALTKDGIEMAKHLVDGGKTV
ncbi:hypothetical protein MASR2M78_33530 [Treponema sp.]